jgi:hypothetical protein
MRLGRRTQNSPVDPIQDPEEEVRDMKSPAEDKMDRNPETRADGIKTEPVADTFGRGTATGPAEARSSEHTYPNSNTSQGNDQSFLDWQSFSLADAYTEKLQIQYIVGNIFQLPSLNIVYGSPGSFKSFLLADLACCVAGGNDWLPPFGNPYGKGLSVIQGATVWIDFDNGLHRTLDRFKALGTTIGISGDAPLKIFTMPHPVLDARDPIQIIELHELLASNESKLIVLDNLAMISGDADENSADMAEIFNNLRRVSELTCSAVVVIHHPRKGTPDQKRLGESLRGHSSIEAAIDLALYINRSGNDRTVDIKPTKVRDYLVEPFSARFDFQLDQDGGLDNARFYSITGIINNQTVLVMDTIWEALADGELNKGKLSKDVKKLLKDTDTKNIGINKIGEIIEYMHEKEFLKMREGDNNARLFSRNPDNPYKTLADEKGGTP